MQVESARYVAIVGSNGVKRLAIDAVIDGVEIYAIEPVSEHWPIIESWIDAGNEPEPYAEPEVIPAPLTRGEFWLAVLPHGVTKTGLRNIVFGIPDADRKESLYIVIDDYASYPKDDSLVGDLLSLTNLTQEQIDSLWVRA